jgi:hypothetical protein
MIVTVAGRVKAFFLNFLKKNGPIKAVLEY